jgi:hypothetical protein
VQKVRLEFKPSTTKKKEKNLKESTELLVIKSSGYSSLMANCMCKLAWPLYLDILSNIILDTSVRMFV